MHVKRKNTGITLMKNISYYSRRNLVADVASYANLVALLIPDAATFIMLGFQQAEKPIRLSSITASPFVRGQEVDFQNHVEPTL